MASNREQNWLDTHDGNWINSLDAVHIIAPTIGGDKAAKAAIVERLKDGAIGAKAWWVASAIDIGKYPYIEPIYRAQWNEGEKCPDFNAADLHEFRRRESRPIVSQTTIGDRYAFQVLDSPIICQGFWQRLKESDLERWDWGSGFCLTSEPPRGWSNSACKIRGGNNLPLRQFALGLEFLKRDVLRIINVSEPSICVSKHTMRGRPPSPRTADWVAELILFHDEEGIDSASPNAIHEKIVNRLSSKGLPELPRSIAYTILNRVQLALRQVN